MLNEIYRQAGNVQEVPRREYILSYICVANLLTGDVHKQYYSKAAASPITDRMSSYYTSASKQILELHVEARRIADEAKQTSEAALTELKQE